MRLRWKMDPRETGLAAVCAGPRASEYTDGSQEYARVMASRAGWGKAIDGWFWTSRVSGELKNTCRNLCKTEGEAKHQASKHVKMHLKRLAKLEETNDN